MVSSSLDCVSSNNEMIQDFLTDDLVSYLQEENVRNVLMNVWSCS